MHYNVIIQKKIRKTRRFCAADKYDANGFPGNGGSEKSEVNGMATYYDDTEYERRGGGFWGKFLAVFLGFLFGIICTLGGLAGLGYVLYAKIKIAEGFKVVNKITGSDIDYSEYITEEYAQKTIADERPRRALLRFPESDGQPFLFGKIFPESTRDGGEHRKKDFGIRGGCGYGRAHDHAVERNERISHGHPQHGGGGQSAR